MILDFLNYFENILISLSTNYRILSYLFLFVVVFIENGVFFIPFLPGDSLFFLAGTIFSSISFIEIFLLFLLLFVAAVLGDLLNYCVGKYIGIKVLQKNWINRKYFYKTEEYFRKYGKKTIFLARFIPIARTFAPLIAGIGKMNFYSFMFYNILGGIFWVSIFLFSGYFFGRINFVKENLSLVILAIVVISLLPAIFEFLRRKFRR